MSINTQNNFPGIVSLLNFNPATGIPLSQLQDSVFRDEGVDLQEKGRRELVAAVLGKVLECDFARKFHAAMAATILGTGPVAQVLNGDYDAVDGIPQRINLARAVLTGNKKELNSAIGNCTNADMDHRDIHAYMLVASVTNMEILYLNACGKGESTLEWEDHMKLAGQVCADGYASMII